MSAEPASEDKAAQATSIPTPANPSTTPQKPSPPSYSLVNSLVGHKKPISSIKFSLTGDLVASSSGLIL